MAQGNMILASKLLLTAKVSLENIERINQIMDRMDKYTMNYTVNEDYL